MTVPPWEGTGLTKGGRLQGSGDISFPVCPCALRFDTNLQTCFPGAVPKLLHGCAIVCVRRRVRLGVGWLCSVAQLGCL